MEATMKRIIGKLAILALLASSGALALAQQAPQPKKTPEPDRAVIPLSNPAKPARVEASVMWGSITVKGYEGKDIIAEARVREKALLEGQGLFAPYAKSALEADELSKLAETAAKSAEAQAKAAEAQARVANEVQEKMTQQLEAQLAAAQQEPKKERSHEGMKLITAALTGLTVEENNNTVTVSTGSMRNAVDLTLQVPYSSSLSLRSMMGGRIVVENVSGEVEVNAANGDVTLRNVSGNAVVHTMSGDIEATIAKVSPDKPLSFSNMGGDIDITLPADTKADLRLKSQMGNIYSDFDVALKPAPQRVEETGKTELGKYRISFDKGIYGTINGGGQEISLTTFNGNIYLRRQK
jgi:hypothetical protein